MRRRMERHAANPRALAVRVGVGRRVAGDKRLGVHREDVGDVVGLHELHVVEGDARLQRLRSVRVAAQHLLQRNEPAVGLLLGLVHFDHQQVAALLHDLPVVRVQKVETEVRDDSDDRCREAGEHNVDRAVVLGRRQRLELADLPEVHLEAVSPRRREAPLDDHLWVLLHPRSLRLSQHLHWLIRVAQWVLPAACSMSRRIAFFVHG
mmetsp:Transcript_70420/g.193234  ORF Transcript_70420/g.193234 Transcript_70420/m.193234 type:complete len:207 (-) Transcript_70420:135-755(-)